MTFNGLAEEKQRITYVDELENIVAERLRLKDARLVQYYSLALMCKGVAISVEDVHNAWAMYMNHRKRSETCYGHEHINIVPFYQLNDAAKRQRSSVLITLRNIAAEISQE